MLVWRPGRAPEFAERRPRGNSSLDGHNEGLRRSKRNVRLGLWRLCFCRLNWARRGVRIWMPHHWSLAVGSGHIRRCGRGNVPVPVLSLHGRGLLGGYRKCLNQLPSKSTLISRLPTSALPTFPAISSRVWYSPTCPFRSRATSISSTPKPTGCGARLAFVHLEHAQDAATTA